MTRENLAAVLEEIALLLELKDENPFKVRAYRHGAETIRNFDGDIVRLATDNQLTGIKGIGRPCATSSTNSPPPAASNPIRTSARSFRLA